MFILTVELISIMFAVPVVKSGLKLEDSVIFGVFFFVSNTFGLALLALSKVSVGDFVKITKAFGNFVKMAEK